MANIASGANAQLLIQKENNWGVKPVQKKALLLTNVLAGESIGTTIEEIQSAAINPVRGVHFSRNGQKTTAGSLSQEVSAKSMITDLNFYGLLGDYVQTEEVDGKFKKVFKRGATIPSFYLQKGFTDIDLYFDVLGLQYNQMTFTAEAEGALSMTVDYMGKSSTNVAEVYDEDAKVDESELMNGIDVTAITEGGATSCYSNLNFTYTNAMENGRCLGFDTVTASAVGRGEITGSVTQVFKNLAIYTKWINETESVIRFKLEYKGNSLEVVFPRIKFTGSDNILPVIDSDGMINVTYPFRALVSKADLSDIIVTTINDNDLDAFLA